LEQFLIRFGIPAIILLFVILQVLILPILGDKSKKARRTVARIFILLITLFVLLTYNEVKEAPIVFEIDKVFATGMIFRIDLLNYILIILAGILWLTIGIYDFEKVNYFFFTLTYISTIGTLMAGDLISFFLFFEIMTFSSYALMVYHRGKEQLEAGYVYIYMGVIGGLSILSGILMLSVYTGTFEWTNLAVEFSEMGRIKYVIAFFLISGFGIKAGMVPFHFWVPKIYQGAPISIVALSSGMLMKIGAYGILKVFSVILFVDVRNMDSVNHLLWRVGSRVGGVLIWVGILTMLIGVFMALLQGNMKRMLAYHSVSQMGYIIMGVGVAGYLGPQGAMGFVGSVFHMVNHAFFKVLLFMVAGVVYMRTKESNMYELGGLWRKMPVTAMLCLIAVFGITGMPGFNGFASKTVLHHAIIESYEYGHYSYKYAELFFKLVSAGTVCSFIKFFTFIFMGKCPERFKKIEGDFPRMSSAMAILAAFILVIGVYPSIFMNKLLAPAAVAFQYDLSFINKYIYGMDFWNAKDVVGTVGVYFFGLGMFIIGFKYHLFHMRLPKWINAERYIFTPVTSTCERVSDYCIQKYERRIIFGDVFMYTIILTGILTMWMITHL